jgi:3-oxoadipate enol-lactonase
MGEARVGDIRMHYEEAGAGPPLVLVHGLGACADDWEFQIPFFARSYRVIVPELRGFGRTERGQGALSIARFADDLWNLLGQLGVRQAVLIGHSMGGAVSMQLALDHPGFVTHLVLANSVPTFQPRSLRQRFEIYYRLLVMRLLGPRQLAQISAVRMYPEPDQQALRERVIARSRYNTTANYTAALQALTRWSVLDRLRELTMPSIVLASEHDYYSREDSVGFAHELPRGRFHSFAGRHHGLPLEAPEEFNAVVQKFLSAK